MPFSGQFYQPRGRGHAKGSSSSRRPRDTTPAPPPPPPPPPPQHSPTPDPGQDEDDEDHPRKRRRGEEVEPDDEEWAAGMWLLDPRASMATMAANGNKHIYDEIRNITRLCGGHHANYANILSQGIKDYDVDKDDGDHAYWKSKEYDSVAEAYMLFPVFVKYFPHLHDNIDYLASHRLLVQKFAQFCDKVAVKSRSDDIGRIKLHTVAIAQFKDERLKRKENRGMNHIESAQKLVPPRMLEQLHADPEGFLDLLRTNKVKIFSSDWPTMMYDMDLYRPGEHKAGFLKGRFLKNMVKTIFTGFSSTDVAEPGTYSGQGQPTVAKKHSMTSITIHAVVYIAALVSQAIGCLLHTRIRYHNVQARFALTSHSKWSDMEGDDWNCRDFIQLILNFAHHNADWTDEIIAYWNKEIFGDGAEEDEETRAQRQNTSYYQAISSECTGHRRPPPRSRSQTLEPMEPQESDED